MRKNNPPQATFCRRRLHDPQRSGPDHSTGPSGASSAFSRLAFEDVIGGGGSGNRVLGLTGAVPIEGGLPVIVDGKIVGAIGVSGGSGAQDGQVAKAGLEGLK